ncbi:Uncharacterized protein DBV15_00843 [Temnothorax longispinosus]|uniref:Uncharacterized protein n=1 Tax=Temnothorax longispinosus TaxID=300112 RepID=A0A4S2KKB0_9HYME|nr:Uncharacterized protein DBV15_00843 [Temnothorax longispinosus]
MGDYSASLFSSTLTSPKPNAITSNSSSSNFSAAVTITTSTMQDDLLIEKQAAGKPAPLSPSGALDTVAGQDKSKDVIEAESIAITPTTPSSTEKDITCSTTSALQGFADPGGRVPSLWSAPDDGGLHTAPRSSGARAHKRLPPRSPVRAYLRGTVADPSAAGLQGRKPSPTFPGHPGPAAAHPSCISPVKFRRSTSYPGKGNIYPPQPAPTFEVTAAEERDLLQMPPFQQVSQSQVLKLVFTLREV